MRRLCVLLAITVLGGAAAPTGASTGSDFSAVLKAFQATGKIDGCKFSAATLASAEGGVTPDIDTYAPEFPDALDAAQRQRASGACANSSRKDPPGTTSANGDAAAAPGVAATPPAGSPPTAPGPAPAGAPAGPGAPAPGTTTPAPAPEVTAAAAAADGSIATAAAGGENESDTPLALLLLLVLAALAALLALVWAVVRALAIDPPWFATGRHATAEAGWRASASWAEFTDWVRLGR